MPSNYNGKAGSMAAPGILNIQSSTNANPVVVATDVAHGLITGDTVWIYDHQINTVINGMNPVTVVDATHFSIALTGVGIGGATGTVQSLAFSPSSFQIPSDATDDMSAASVNVGLEALADRTALIAEFVRPLLISGGIVRPVAVLSHTDKTLASNGSVSLNNSEVLIANSAGTITKLNLNQVVIFLYTANVAGTGTVPQIALGFVSYAPGATPGAYTSLEFQAVDATIRGRVFVGATTFVGMGGGNMNVGLIGFDSGIGSAAFYGSYSLTALVIG